MERLLIVACSQRKRPETGKLSAIERYDGPVFRVIRKYLREVAEERLRVLIVSAKHGLIAAQHEIDYYDCRLAEVSVDSLRPTVLDEASRVLSSQHWQSVGVCASKDYLEVLAGLIEALPHGVSLDVLGGGQGKRLTAVRNWLHQGRAQSAP